MASRTRKFITLIKEILVPLFELNNDQDEIFLSAGNHELVIETNYAPKKVWFTFTEQDGIPVCGGNVDKVGITMLPKGFIVSAQIHSDVRGIRWFAELDPSIEFSGSGPYGNETSRVAEIADVEEEDAELSE